MGSADSSSDGNQNGQGMSAGRRRLHLRGERALGLESLNVRSRGGGQGSASRPAGAAQPKESQTKAADLSRAASHMRQPATATKSVPSEKSASIVRSAAEARSKPAVPNQGVPTDFKQVTMPDLLNDKPFTSAALSRDQKLTVLQELDERQVKPCQKCGLCQTRNQTVFGEGDADARLMFIGEGPGGEEDASGRPFVGRAGQLLEKMINAMGLQREQVFIANIVKCRAYHVEPSPKDRPPSPQEVAACSPYLLQQIEIIRPAVIVTLGLPASQFLLGSKLAMGKMRGSWSEFRGLKVMPTYHPSYVLRNYTDETRALVWGDLQKVMIELGLKR